MEPVEMMMTLHAQACVFPAYNPRYSK